MHWNGNALYEGEIYLGRFFRMFSANWREIYKAGSSAYDHALRMEKTPWRVWLMTDEDGEEIGPAATENEAKALLWERSGSALAAEKQFTS